GRRPQPEHATANVRDRLERDFVEDLPERLVLLNGERGLAAIHEIRILTPYKSWRRRGKEKQRVLDCIPAERVDDFVIIRRIFLLLDIPACLSVVRIQEQP